MCTSFVNRRQTKRKENEKERNPSAPQKTNNEGPSRCTPSIPPWYTPTEQMKTHAHTHPTRANRRTGSSRHTKPFYLSRALCRLSPSNPATRDLRTKSFAPAGGRQQRDSTANNRQAAHDNFRKLSPCPLHTHMHPFHQLSERYAQTHRTGLSLSLSLGVGSPVSHSHSSLRSLPNRSTR
mmetsp:Transcript_25911/g.64368  ORF Transcript_25911/g.64368 Transcript_25911/m.64368 type:complete len:180 (+) Transcript_25911:167-706(+)